MSPASQQARKRYAQYQRSSNIRKLSKLEDSEVVLSDEQSEEMCEVMEAMKAKDLDKLYQEGDQHGVGSVMKTLWMTHKDRQKKQFFLNQEENSVGGRGNQWNMITIRMALAIYTRSPAAYKALQSFEILKLPSKSTMQAYTGAFMHAPGASNVCIVEQVSQYVLFKEECRKNGRQEPKSDGALIFDEVKVACQLMWNSQNHQLMGLAMTSKDMESLSDIYRILKNPEANQTSYILQFIWRDLTSSYDIVGLYYMSAASVEAKFVVACVFETISK
ncbi:uncharacterized protein [Dysidea avara]|uniref:uncharacterized protein n=1 Tax=Dysidea avara TaxID=196820 RepID=UPI0033169659